ncbi:MAG: c-type cytochrome, partial [Nitrospinota bacterium]
MRKLNKLSRRAGYIAVALLLTFAVASPLQAATGNAANGKKIYMKKCKWCHGVEGEADGPAAEFLIPPPRNFAEGVYKYNTSKYDPDISIPRDEDIFNRISEGMPGTGMPSWKEVLKEQERWDLVAFVKSLTDLFEGEANPPQIDYSGKIPSSPESIERGHKLFEDAKCWECHGREGKGDTMKKLKEDSGARVWPRNFSKPWTFRGGYTAEDIFSRITNGIPNTPMPSFHAEKTGTGKLSVEDRWHVVNYVMSLADENRMVKEGQIVIKGVSREAMPKDENDPAWNEVSGTAFRLVPQIIQKDRFFIPANDLVIVKTVYTEKEIAFLLELDDRTKSIPGDNIAEAISWDGFSPDAMAIQTPVVIPKLMEKPYFGHGDGSHAVSMLYWNSGSVEKPGTAKMFTAKGSKSMEESDVSAAGFSVSASYHDGTWRVMMKRNLTTPNKEKDTQFEVGRYIPIAFADWDGSNGERGSKHTMTTWYWLLLQPETGSKVVTYPGAAFILLVLGQFLFSAYL